MAVSIDTNTFPAEGGSFTIQITKDDNRPWSVTPPSAGWISSVIGFDQSNHLYELSFDLSQNTNVADRTTTFVAGSDLESETFSITQFGTGTTLSADIIASTPSGSIASSGGQFTVDVYANGGNDSLSSASSSDVFCTVSSTTHGVTSGGLTCTRFVFNFTANSNPSNRTATLTFTVRNGGDTATTTLTKTQLGVITPQGTLAVGDISVVAAATSAQSVITQTGMDTSTLAGTTSAAWVTDIQTSTSGGVLYLNVTITANTGVSARSTTITLTGDDIYGNTITTTCTLTQAGTGTTRSIDVAWISYLGYDGVLNYMGGTEQASITYTGTFTGNASVTTGTLPDGLTVTLPSNSTLEATYTGGMLTQTQTIPITVKRTGSDSVVYSFTINLILQAGGVYPIWRDVLQTIQSDEDWEDYELYEGGDLLYAGRAFLYPDESDIRVNISRVVAPYLTDYYKDITVTNAGTQIGSYTFVRDYSYDPNMDYTQNQALNAPINGRIPSGAKVSVSVWAAGNGGSLVVTDEGGSLVVNTGLVKGLNTGEWISGSAGKKYTCGDVEYEVVDMCQGVLLKYVNAYGAMDYLVVEGVCKKQDKITRATYEKDASALSLEFESKDYQATMEANWTGTTGWLTDSQSKRMKHLVESVEVYMIDSEGNETPVCMEDGTLDYKTFISNGRKLVNYTLKWSESQKKIRR